LKGFIPVSIQIFLDLSIVFAFYTLFLYQNPLFPPQKSPVTRPFGNTPDVDSTETRSRNPCSEEIPDYLATESSSLH
jgi:hypothetical protein